MKNKLIAAIAILGLFGIPAMTSASPSPAVTEANPSAVTAQRAAFASLVADPFGAPDLVFAVPANLGELLGGPGQV